VSERGTLVFAVPPKKTEGWRNTLTKGRESNITGDTIKPSVRTGPLGTEFDVQQGRKEKLQIA